MQGRIPIPTAVKLINGNPGKRRLNENEPEPPGELCDPPDEMSDEEKAIWRKAIADAPPGMLREIDGTLLQLWVEAKEMRRKAREEVATHGACIVSAASGALKKNPYQQIIDQQTDIIKGLTGDLGFSATSRARVGGVGVKGPRNRFSNNSTAKR